MTPQQVQAEFESRLREEALALQETPSKEILAAFLELYLERVEGCPLEEDGDMLLLQWGSYDWGAGLEFTVELVRQFITASGDDHEMFQLHLSFVYAPAGMEEEFSSGQVWCGRPDALEDFSRVVLGESPFAALSGRPARRSELHFERV
jgi:hypothetical protein